jgi:hypothetical protein
MRVLGGSAERSCVKASRPPADAPIPTMGKSGPLGADGSAESSGRELHWLEVPRLLSPSSDVEAALPGLFGSLFLANIRLRVEKNVDFT